MPPQHVEIAETIAALKRALRREKEPPSDQVIRSATNRGNKLQKGASYVHAGSLPYQRGPDGYKQRIEHSGYNRYVLARNPKRYNEYGDELDDSESDTEADADAEEENPYSGIRLEELLCPLKHPAELAVHPTLSTPFLDSALPNMVQTTEEKLRRERANLWRAKNLNRQFIGDESWMPCASVESNEDWDMFEPRPRTGAEQNSRKRKRNTNENLPNGQNGQVLEIAADDVSVADHAKLANEKAQVSPKTAQMNGVQSNIRPANKHEVAKTMTEDVNMTDGAGANGVHVKKSPHDSPPETVDAAGVDRIDQAQEGIANNVTNGDMDSTSEEHDHASNDETPPPPTRRITRALAAENNNSNAPTPPLSPTSSMTSVSSSLLVPDPLFLLPASVTASHHFSTNPLARFASLQLPVEELLETRRLLTMYIQKQEESVRGYENVLGKLIKAKKMRDRVYEWAKAEGHVGEMEDGEDWIDVQAWGLKEGELSKGKDEEEVGEGAEEVGRKGKRRRRE